MLLQHFTAKNRRYQNVANQPFQPVLFLMRSDAYFYPDTYAAPTEFNY
jgi:hypothetical protein